MPKEEIVFRSLGEMPEYQRIALAEFALAITESCFSKPGMEAEFLAWLPGYLEAQEKKGGRKAS